MVKGDGGLQEKPIKTGWRDGDFIEVLLGLDENDEVGIPRKPERDKKKRRFRR